MFEAYASCLSGVAGLAQQRCPDQLGPSGNLRDEDEARVKHVIWDLILERVLVALLAFVESGIANLKKVLLTRLLFVL